MGKQTEYPKNLYIFKSRDMIPKVGFLRGFLREQDGFPEIECISDVVQFHKYNYELKATIVDGVRARAGVYFACVHKNNALKEHMSKKREQGWAKRIFLSEGTVRAAWESEDESVGHIEKILADLFHDPWDKYITQNISWHRNYPQKSVVCVGAPELIGKIRSVGEKVATRVHHY